MTPRLPCGVVEPPSPTRPARPRQVGAAPRPSGWVPGGGSPHRSAWREEPETTRPPLTAEAPVQLLFLEARVGGNHQAPGATGDLQCDGAPPLSLMHAGLRGSLSPPSAEWRMDGAGISAATIHFHSIGSWGLSSVWGVGLLVGRAPRSGASIRGLHQGPRSRAISLPATRLLTDSAAQGPAASRRTRRAALGKRRVEGALLLFPSSHPDGTHSPAE